jgi:flavin-dependent dehydrogenase
MMDRVPEIAAKVKAGKREEPYLGTADQPNYFRQPYGPGWALVGDAGYHRDFITGLGINDAFRDTELLVEAVDEGFSGKRPMEEAMADYEAKRNDFALPLYRITTKMAAGEMTDMSEFMMFGIALARTMPVSVPA